ncbi:hypothetical protein QIS74_13166 [Colletotrichum tabaci]|uniref:Uncharacterized protein n=1 Tax=Colletotrichum tabaci TaxID=1209068 RepID=A0AAV9ST38_9PEZI
MVSELFCFAQTHPAHFVQPADPLITSVGVLFEGLYGIDDDKIFTVAVPIIAKPVEGPTGSASNQKEVALQTFDVLLDEVYASAGIISWWLWGRRYGPNKDDRALIIDHAFDDEQQKQLMRSCFGSVRLLSIMEPGLTRERESQRYRDPPLQTCILPLFMHLTWGA